MKYGMLNDIDDFWDRVHNDDFEDQNLLITSSTMSNYDSVPKTALSQESTGTESTVIPDIPKVDIDKQVEEAIESNPTVAEQVTEDVSGEGSPIETEAEQLNDLNPSNNEVNDEAIKQTPVQEKQEILDKLKNTGSSFMNVSLSSPEMNDFINSVEQSERTPEDDNAKVSSIDWDKVKVYEPGEDAEGYGIEKDSYDPRVEAIREYEYETGVGDPGVLLHRDEDFAGPDEYVDEASGEIKSIEDRQLPALNQQDYHKELAVDGERGLETTDDLAYTVEGESDFEPTVYKIEDLDREIEEAEQMPVTNAEEAKAKQNKLKELRARRVAYGNASKSDTNWNYGKSTATGGRVSPRAGIGSIGGGSSGHGSMSSTKPSKVVDSHNSIASKAPLPHALEDNQGRVVSVNGKVTTAPSSNNNGAFRSGSFGLMSKAKSNFKPIPSKAPVSGGAEHMSDNAAMSDINLENGKQILIERLKQLLAQLTDEEKRQLRFSPALNQWNGKPLTRLDGYTLQDLINKVEEYLGEVNSGMAQ